MTTLGSCKRERDFAGFGKYVVGKTTLADATGRCEPTDLPDGRKGTWCYLNPPLGVAGRPADVDMYFLGAEPKAPLIELQLDVRGCDPAKLMPWLRTRFGAPAEHRPEWASWNNDKIFLVAEMPVNKSRCLVRVLPKSERAEFDRIRAKSLPTPPT